MKNHVVLFFAFAMVTLLSGCAGTRLCEKIWSVGTSEDYIMNPLYAKSKLFVADDEYYLQCTQRTYHDNPGFYFLVGAPLLSYRLNDISYIENSEKQVTVKISPKFAHTLQLDQEVCDLPKEDISPYYNFLSYVENVCPALPDGAEPLAINLRDELREDDDVWGHVSPWVNGTGIMSHKSAESYLLTPLMIPALAVDIVYFFAWPLNIIVAMPFLNNDCYSSYETGEVNESIE